MLFNSVEFACFLPIAFLIYWSISANQNSFRNLVLLILSYIFYGWWDHRLLLLIVFSSAVDFILGIMLQKSATLYERRLLLGTSIAANIGMLAVFKYYDFFVLSLAAGLTQLGVKANLTTLNLILPVGISFYTFQTLSYTIDIYRRKLEPTKNIVAFFAFVAFFPQLVAGPIERATNLLGQFETPRVFRFVQARDGLRQILWGVFKKVVIADLCGLHVNAIFSNYDSMPASTLVLGAVYFAFQIYGDFSGYSDIAIGVANLFGFELMRNFRVPYFSRDVAEFWRRWHISLSSWFRDYLYIPLGGSRGGLGMTIRNTLIVFLVSGLWHGANWTFVIWGLLHWLYFLPLLLNMRNRTYLGPIGEGRWFPSLREGFSMLLTFSLVTVAWVFFRAENVGVAADYLLHICDSSILSMTDRKSGIPWVVLLIVWDWSFRDREHGLDFDRVHVVFRWGIYLMMAIACLAKFQRNSEFIYFQF